MNWLKGKNVRHGVLDSDTFDGHLWILTECDYALEDDLCIRLSDLFEDDMTLSVIFEQGVLSAFGYER